MTSSRPQSASRPSSLSTAALAGSIAACLSMGGCFVPGLVGAIGNEIERNKKIEVLAEYEGLENRTVAVLVHADASTLYDFPTASVSIAGNVAFRLQANVKGISVLAPATVVQWQYQTPAWTTLPYGQVADELGVDRVVVIDIYEFRLNPPGNQYMWDAVAAANVGIIEADSIEPDSFASTFDVRAAWPTSGDPLPREAVSLRTVEGGLMTMFVQKCAWVFFTHIEDKYPDK